MATERKTRQVLLQKTFLGSYFYRTSDGTGRDVLRLQKSQETVNEHIVKDILMQFRKKHKIESEMMNERTIKAAIPVIVGEKYMPQSPRIYEEGYHSYLNSWSEPLLQPSKVIDPAMPRPKLWQELLDRWFKKPEEAAFFESFLAFMVRKPLESADMAVVLRSAQGCGKNFLWDQVVTPMVGKTNAPTTSLKQLTGTFSADLYRSTAVLLDEMYSDNKLSADKLKSIVTGRSMRTEEKNIQAVTLRKHFKLIITSNSHKPLHIEAGDRRYWVCEYIDHKTSKEETAEFLATFSVWLDGKGLQELRDWFELVVCEERMFRTAPDTEAKAEITARDKTADYQVELQDFLEPRKGGFVFSVTQIQADRFRYLAERDIASVLRDMGFIEKRRLSYGRARLWEHPALATNKDEKAMIWSMAAENSRFRG